MFIHFTFYDIRHKPAIKMCFFISMGPQNGKKNSFHGLGNLALEGRASTDEEKLLSTTKCCR